VTLACGNEVGQVLVKVLDLSIGLVANVRVSLGKWSLINVASIRQNSRVDCADNPVNMLDESCMRADIRGGQDLLHVGCIRKPGEAMDMRAATMLPLKAKPEIGSTENTNIESIDELLDAVMEEPVSNGRVLLEGFDHLQYANRK